MKRQLQVVEQEANVLRTRNQNLESDNEKLVSENKRLLLTQGAKKSAQDRANNLDFKLKMGEMEKKLEDANQKVNNNNMGLLYHGVYRVNNMGLTNIKLVNKKNFLFDCCL